MDPSSSKDGGPQAYPFPAAHPPPADLQTQHHQHHQHHHHHQQRQQQQQQQQQQGFHYTHRPPLQPRTSSSSLASNGTFAPRIFPRAPEMAQRSTTSSTSSATSIYSQSSHLQHQNQQSNYPHLPPSPPSTIPASDSSSIGAIRRASASPSISRRPSTTLLHTRSASQMGGSEHSNRYPGPSTAPPLNPPDSAYGFFAPSYYPGAGSLPATPATISHPTTPTVVRGPSLAAASSSEQADPTRGPDGLRLESATKLSDRSRRSMNVEAQMGSSSSAVSPQGSAARSTVYTPSLTGVPSPTLHLGSKHSPQYAQLPTRKNSSTHVGLPVVPRRNSSVSHRGGDNHERNIDATTSSPVSSPIGNSPPSSSLSFSSPLPRPPLSAPPLPASSDSSDYGSDADLEESIERFTEAEEQESETGTPGLEGDSTYALESAARPPRLQRPQRRGFECSGSSANNNPMTSTSESSAEQPHAIDPSTSRSALASDQAPLRSEEVPSQTVPKHESLVEHAQSAVNALPFPPKELPGTEVQGYFSSQTPSVVATDGLAFQSSPLLGPKTAADPVRAEDEAAFEAAMLMAAEAEDPNRPRTLKEARELAKTRVKARQRAENGGPGPSVVHSATSLASPIRGRHPELVPPLASTSSRTRSTPRRDTHNSIQSHDPLPVIQAAPTHASDTEASLEHIQTMDELQAAVGDVLHSLTFGVSPPDVSHAPSSFSKRREATAARLPPLPDSFAGLSIIDTGIRHERPESSTDTSAAVSADDSLTRSTIGSSTSSLADFVTPSQLVGDLPTLDSQGTIHATGDSSNQSPTAEREDEDTLHVLPAEAFLTGLSTPPSALPTLHSTNGVVRQQRSNYFTCGLTGAPLWSAASAASYPEPPHLQKRSSSQLITAATRLHVPGRTIPFPPAFNAAAIYVGRKKLPPWERARGYAELINDLANTPTGLGLWMEASQRRPFPSVSNSSGRTAKDQTVGPSEQRIGQARYPSEARGGSATTGQLHPRDASGASVGSDMTFPTRGDGGKARDVTDTSLDRVNIDAMPGAVPANIPYPALARPPHQKQDVATTAAAPASEMSSTSQSSFGSASVYSQGSASSQRSAILSGKLPSASSSANLSYISNGSSTAFVTPGSRTERLEPRQQASTDPLSSLASPSVSTLPISSSRSGLFGLARRSSRRGVVPSPIGMLTPTSSVAGPRGPRSGGGGASGALGRVIGYGSGSSGVPITISSPTSATHGPLESEAYSAPSSTSTSHGLTPLPVYPGSTPGQSTGSGPLGPRTQALRSGASMRTSSSGTLEEGRKASQTPLGNPRQEPHLPLQGAGSSWMERGESVDFSRHLSSLRDVLPDADEEVLRGYLERVGGRDEVKAIGDYLADQRAGRLRA